MRKIICAVFLCCASVCVSLAQTSSTITANVFDFGAQADGLHDDTAAIQSALDSMSAAGGRVYLPAGKYLVRSHLAIPPYVTLEGTATAPPTTALEMGSRLLATADRGTSTGEPFITLHRCSTLKGIQVFYPDQTTSCTEYPWCVRGIGDNCAILDCLLINPYLGVDFGTFPAGRHYIKGLYGGPLKVGLFIDKCFDVGRVEDVHFWPFWNEQVMDFTRSNATAFRIAKTDWEYMLNCFCIGYNVGYDFVSLDDGPGNAILTQCGSDVGPLSVNVQSVQAHSGVSFINSQFMAGVHVGENNSGPVKFTACGFWGVDKYTNSHALLSGSGHTSFDNCHFVWWGMRDPNAFAIAANSGVLSVTNCDFLDEQATKRHIYLGSDIDGAVISGNRFRTKPVIENDSDAEVVIANNITVKARELQAALEANDQAKVTEYWRHHKIVPTQSTLRSMEQLASAILLKGSDSRLRAQLLKSLASNTSIPLTVSSRASRELSPASDSRSAATAVFTSRQPVLNGKMDESEWKGARPLQFETGGVTTSLKLLYTEDALYVGALLSEPLPGQIRAKQTSHDGQIWTDDSIELFFCPGSVVHHYYQLIVNSRGTIYDGTGNLKSTNSADWNTSTSAAASVERDHWCAEIRIPWSSFGLKSKPKPREDWTADFRRWRFAAGTEQYSSWAGAPLKGDTHHPEAFKTLHFGGAK